MASDKELTIRIQADTKEASTKISSLLEGILKEFGHVQSSAEETAKAFEDFGIKSVAEIQKIKEQAIKNFEIIKNSGTATPEEISAAHSAMTKIIEQNTEQQVSFTGKLANSWKALKGAWIEIALIVGSLNFLRKMATSAIEAQETASKLKFQIEGLGISFESVKDSINEATQATAKYAIVQDEDVQAVLQQLIFVTGDLKKSQESLNLVYDLAYQKGIGVGEAANIIAKGMTGNLEPLGRQFVEFRNLNEEMGKHVIQADKIAIFQAFMTERVKGSIKEMSVQKQIIQGFGKYWADWAQAVGGAALSAVRWIDDLTLGYEEALEVTQKLGKLAYASVGDQYTMIANEKNLLAIKELILEVTKEKEISEKEIEKIVFDVTEAYKKEAFVVKKNMEERKAGEKRISDLIESRIKEGTKATAEEKKALEEKKKLTEDFYKDFAAKSKQIEGEILKRRIENYNSALSRLKETLTEAKSEYEKYKAEVIRIEDEIEAERKKDEVFRKDSSRKFLDENQQAILARKDAEASLSNAKRIALSGDLEAAKEAFAQAKSEYDSLMDFAKDKSDTFSGTSQKIAETAKKGYDEAAKGMLEVLEAQKKIASENMEESEKAAINAQSQIAELEIKIKTLMDMSKKMEFEILVKGYEEALAKKAELEKATSSTHTIYTVQVNQNAPRGSNEAIDTDLNEYFQGLSEGGDIQPIKAANGRHFPGFGGGDKIPILGEAGEYMSDKNTVRYWSPKMFEVLKMRDSGALLNYLGANKMSQEKTFGAMDKISVDLNLGGKTFPMNTSKNTGTDFAKQIKQLNVLRGRYKQPY